MNELSEKAQSWLETLGKFEPARHDGEMQMVGHCTEKIGGLFHTYPWYMPADGWVELAAVCNEIAGWLEFRNMAPQDENQRDEKTWQNMTTI
jgi:hypothetical protein